MPTRKALRYKTEEPVSARWTNGGIREVSGLFFYAAFAPDDGSQIEVVVKLPAEVTGSDAKTVLCRGRVVRVEAVEEGAPETKYGVAVEMDSYELIYES